MPRKKTIQPEPSETFTMEDGTVVEIRNHEALDRLVKERQQQRYIRRYEADFPYWLKMATWRSDEGAALIHGLEPRRIKLPYPDSTKELFPIIKSWVECREHAVCALRAGQLRESSKPVEFLRWAESIGYPIPEGLQGFYKACENGVHKKPTEQTSKVLTGVMEAPAGKVEAVPSTNPSSDDDTQIDTTNLVYWRVILYSNIKKIDEHKKASARGIIKYLRGLKDKRIPNKGGHDELFWIDDNNNEQCVAKKTINNLASLARKLP